LAALRFLSDDLGLALAPRVIAADVPAGLLVLEDLAPRVALDHLIRT
jgi:aminoglycoside/choline kinase family phosphotransferase